MLFPVLLDENQMSADEIQKLTNHLCYLYSRCSRSISIPAPVHYAHLAASRARAHIQAVTQQRVYDCGIPANNLHRSNNNHNTSKDTSGQDARVHHSRQRVPQVDNFNSYIDMKSDTRCSMYFC